MKLFKESAQIGSHEISIETGIIAKQADGTIIVRADDTVVFVTVVSDPKPKEGASFFPLTVEYRENAFAFGKIPGGFFKREGRPGEAEILVSRLIDRPIRPLFPEGYYHETQVICHPLSADPASAPDILAITGASAALCISDIPWEGPIAGVRVVRVNGEFIANPTLKQTEAADLNIVMAASRHAIVMVEGEAQEVPEQVLLDALQFGHDAIQPLLDMQERLAKAVGKPKRAFAPPTFDEAIVQGILQQYSPQAREVYCIKEKQDRYAALGVLQETIRTTYREKLGEETFVAKKADIEEALERLKRDVVRKRIIHEKMRIDGRDLTTVRPIDIILGWLPRVHGSALFTRGETQANVTVTLGTSEDEQKIETLGGSSYKSFIFHYNFPPYSVGEARPVRSPGRREIGHGNLAGRSVEQIIPDRDNFPYTLRVVSDITESNGSSSMASVCGASLALMQAGVPIKRAIAGVAMGLISEDGQTAVLTDILGDEDHLGDMDFKVTGTRQGVCAIQMDIKISGLTREIMENALEQARNGRLHILDRMDEFIAQPNAELSPYAPRIVVIYINPDRIRTVIGPGGKTIRSIQEELSVQVSVDDTGKVTIASPDEDACQKAINMIKQMTREVTPGEIYLGVVKGIKEFGAFVEILPGQEGLLHVTQIHSEYIEQVTDILREGDEVLVKVLEIDAGGKIRLSRKAAIEDRSRNGMTEPSEPEGTPVAQADV